MLHQLIKTQNLLIAFLLSLLGFTTACSKNNNSMGIEYGTPHATFKVFGKITSESRTKIPAIRVVMKSETFWVHSDTVISDFYGNYEVKVSDFPTDHHFEMEFTDIDDQANGLYQSKDTIAVFKDAEYEGGESWYAGETSKELNIQLKEEK